MQRSWKTLLPLIVLALVVGYLYTQRHPGITQSAATPPIAAPTNPSESNIASSDQLPAFLPPEARQTLAFVLRPPVLQLLQSMHPTVVLIF